MKDGFLVRAMTRSEMDWAIGQARREGWNPGLDDAECFYQADPNGFLIGLRDGEPVGCISAVSYEGKFGFYGLYIILPAFRGGGYGWRLSQVALKQLESMTTGLDGVLAQEATYARNGFRTVYYNTRFEEIAGGASVPEPPEIRPLREVPFEQVAAYDRLCFPAKRDSFLRSWLSAPSVAAVGYTNGGALKGYGAIRRCRQGYKIGPLFADDGDIAESIYASLVSRAEEEQPVYLDVPQPNAAAMALARRRRMRGLFDTARMYMGKTPDIAVEKVFGVTSFELG